METDDWRTRLARGGATHLSSHARHPRPATSDTTERKSGPSPADSPKKSQLAPVGNLPPASDVTDEPNHNSKPQSGSGSGAAAVTSPGPEGYRVRLAPTHQHSDTS